MPDFQYIARETTGAQVAGVLTAPSERDALSALAAKQLFPVQIGLAAAEKAEQKQIRRRVRAKHLAIFYTQLADLLRSGVPLLRSLELLERKTPNETMRLVVQDVREQVSDGTRLAEAMWQHEKVFGELAVRMIRAGEEGSFLEDVLQRIAAFTEHQENLKGRVFGAMVYPFFLLLMGVVIVVGMLTWFVPKFQPIFDNLKSRGGLPWATTTLMQLSDHLKGFGALGFTLCLIAGVVIYRWLQTEDGRTKFDLFRLKSPGLGPIVRSLAVARFCRILGTLLKNGVPILQSLRIAGEATGNRVLSTAITQAADSVSTGRSLARPLSVSGQFPEDIVEMIAIAEEANNLEQVLINIADNMERQTNRNLELFVRMVEPLMLTVMAGIILFVVVALMLPIMQSSGVL